MNTGKLAPHHDPRMPSKAPDPAPDNTHKPMPEFPLDPQELKYPPADELSAEPHRTGVSTPQEGEHARSEVPRRLPPLEPATIDATLKAAAACAEACERTARYMEGEGDHARTHRTVARLCAAVCRLLHDHVAHSNDRTLGVLVRDVAATCARTCDACAVLCEMHGPDAFSTESAAACRACARWCRTLSA